MTDAKKPPVAPAEPKEAFTPLPAGQQPPIDIIPTDTRGTK